MPLAAARPLPAPAWYRVLARRVPLLWPLKALGTAAFIILFFQAYFFVMHRPSQVPWVMPRLAVDDWVAFTPAAFPVYASLWIYVSLPPALVADLRTLLRYGAWMALLCAACLLVFWAWPTQAPPAAIDWSTYPALSLIKSVDPGGNACPSLHVACAVFASLWLQRQLRHAGAPRGWRLANGLFCLAIAWSTLATRQHVALDVLAGAPTGALFGWLSLRAPLRA